MRTGTHADIRDTGNTLMIRLITAAISAFVLLFILSSCGSKEQNSGQSGNATPQNAAETPVEMSSENAGIQFTAYNLNGAPQHTSEWIGKGPVVLNFWGTWCPPCRREIPDLVKLYEEFHPRGIEMIGLAVKDEPSDVGSYAMRAGMKWVMLMATDEAIQAYDVVNGIPTTIFLAPDGREITRFIGSRPYEEFRPAFEAILRGYQQ